MKNSFIFILISLIYISQTIYSKDIKNTVLRSGDIIFRKENSFLSDRFEKLDGKGYSHIGLIYIKDKDICVVHIERTDTPVDLKVEPVKIFLKKADRYLIKRVKNTDNMDFFSNIKELIKKNPKFDLNFDNTTDDRLYCTEMVYKFYYKNMQIKISDYTSKFGFYDYISIGSILDSKYLVTILNSDDISDKKIEAEIFSK